MPSFNRSSSPSLFVRFFSRGRYRFFGALSLATSVALLGVAGVACGHSGGTAVEPDDAGLVDRARLPAPVHVNPSSPDAAKGCQIVVDSPPLLPGEHVGTTTDIMTWNSNPPSSGQHFPIWAAYQEFTDPVPRGYYVHDLEHGAVVLLHNCANDGGSPDASSPECQSIIDGLHQVAAGLADDPLCVAGGQGIRVRVVTTPDPLLTNKVAAAAWGWTYNATCMDVPTLLDFVKAHYGQGTETTCSNGQTSFQTQ